MNCGFSRLFLLHFFHHLLSGALWTDYVLSILDKAFANHGLLADVAEEALIMPGQRLERDELGAAQASLACDRLVTGSAPLGEQLSKTVSTVRLVIPGGESLAGEGLLAVGAGEALPVPGVAPVGHSALGDHLAAFDALGGELVLVTLGAVDVVLLGDEGLRSNGIFTGAADETLFMPLPRLVLHLLHACSEDISTSVAASGELRIITRTTVNPVCLAAELLVHQAAPALVAQEARLVPVLLLVGQVLGVDADNLATLVAVVGEYALVALDAVRVVLSQHVPVAG